MGTKYHFSFFPCLPIGETLDSVSLEHRQLSGLVQQLVAQIVLCPPVKGIKSVSSRRFRGERPFTLSQPLIDARYLKHFLLG